MSYDFFHMFRSVSLARITSVRLKAVGESLMLLMAWAAIVIFTFVWVSLLIRGFGYIGTELAIWL